MPRLETQRLILRRIIMDDLNEFHILCADDKAMRYMPETYCTDKNRSHDRLERMVKNDSELNSGGFAIANKDTNKFMGLIGLAIEDGDKTKHGNHRRSLGFFMQPQYWGKGYMTEAAKAVLEFGFQQLDAHKISAGCLSENVASEKIMVSIGMKKEAHFVEHVFHENQWKDQVRYGLLKSDWIKSRNNHK